MVCVPCFVIPICLFIWHRFLQPLVLKFWNPFGKVEDKASQEASETSASVKKSSCPFSSGSQNSEVPHPVEAMQVEESKKTS